MSPPRPFRLKHLRLFITALFAVTLAALWLAGHLLTETPSAQAFPPNTFHNFESPQVHPLALTPDGTRLLAVNSPNATLSVFQLNSGTPWLTAEIPVGLEPVSVAARNDREAWVVNWLSDSVSVGWVQRPEFTARYPVPMSAQDFVTTLNANAGTPLDASERDALAAQLAANNSVQGRAAALRRLAEHPEFARRELNRAFVLAEYFGYLRRNPNDAPEQGLDFTGYNHWLTKLEQFNGNYVEAEMVNAFISSIEYRRRFGQQ